MKTLTMLFAIPLLTLTLACGDDGSAQNPSADTGPAIDQSAAPIRVAFDGLASHQGVQGKLDVPMKVEGAPTKVELLADGKVVATATEAPFTISFDSTAVADGIVTLSLAAHGGAEPATSEEVPVIVYNQGEMAAFLTSSKVLVSVPKTGTVGHKKFNYSMPSGYNTLITVVTWDAEGFEMDLAVGVGHCPGSGTMAAQKVGKDSPLVVTYSSQAGDFSPGLWFAHLAVNNVSAIRGASTSVEAKAYLLRK